MYIIYVNIINKERLKLIECTTKIVRIIEPKKRVYKKKAQTKKPWLIIGCENEQKFEALYNDSMLTKKKVFSEPKKRVRKLTQKDIERADRKRKKLEKDTEIFAFWRAGLSCKKISKQFYIRTEIVYSIVRKMKNKTGLDRLPIK